MTETRNLMTETHNLSDNIYLSMKLILQIPKSFEEVNELIWLLDKSGLYTANKSAMLHTK